MRTYTQEFTVYTVEELRDKFPDGFGLQGGGSGIVETPARGSGRDSRLPLTRQATEGTMDTAVAGECYACDLPIDGTGTDEMGMCDNCLHLWWQHADDPHACSWWCVADFQNYEPKEGK